MHKPVFIEKGYWTRSPFQKRTLSGNVVGSIAVSDHKTIRNNFYKIIFPQKLGEVLKLDPPIFTTPYYNAQNLKCQNYANMGVQTSAKVW